MQPAIGYQRRLFGDDVNVKKKYLCSSCELILRKPVQTSCGHRFCKECLQQCLAARSNCAECRRDGGDNCNNPLDQGYEDNAIKREMALVKTKCYFEGCSWTGAFKEFELVHYSKCRFRPRECSVCHKTISRSQENASSETQVDHVECLFEKIEKLDERLGMPDENAIGSVIPVTERLSAIEHTVQNIRTKLSLIEVPGTESGNRTMENRLDNRKRNENSPDSSVEEKVTIIENVLIVFNRELDSLLNQLADIERQRQLEKNLVDRRMQTMEKMLQMKDMTITEQDRRIAELEEVSYDGTLLWKICEFRGKREDATSGRATSFYSPPFYTSKTGYKMCVRIYLNGDGMGKGSHVSLFFVIMRGKYDALLSWPFRHKVTLMFLDQNNQKHAMDAFRADPTSNSFKRPTSEMNIATGCPLFMPLSQLDNNTSAYVKDDTAFVKVTVSPE